MMKGNFSKGTKEYQFMADFYTFCRDYYEPEQKDEYWKKLVEEATALCNKYDNMDFAVGLVMGFINYTEKRK